VPSVSFHVFRKADALDAVDRDLLDHGAAHARLEHNDVLCRYSVRRRQRECAGCLVRTRSFLAPANAGAALEPVDVCPTAADQHSREETG